MLLDHNTCYQALVTHDRRFDGLLFVGVKTTGIYCRPICPARTPRRDRCAFFANAAAAEGAGFRPCLRCRPELAPGAATVDSSARVATAAARRIAAGALDESGLEDLAAEFSLSSRQLRRVLKRELGIGPTQLAQTQRLLLAKHLLTDSSLPVIDVAFASGFASVRQFNGLFRQRYGLAPTELRRARTPASQTTQQATHDSVTLELDYRPPLAWSPLLKFLADRAIPGVEWIDGNRYLRTVAIDKAEGQVIGWLAVAPSLRPNALRLEVSASLIKALPQVIARVRHLFDLNANPQPIESFLAQSRQLLPLVAQRPGLRVPGAFDAFEMAARAVIGQQISVRGASTLTGRLVQTTGQPITTPHAQLNRLAPTAAQVAAVDSSAIASVGLVRTRAATLLTLARAVASGALRLHAGADAEATIEELKQLPGIGDWTAQYIAMHSLGWPDAFLAGDLGVRKVLGQQSPKQILALAESWRPFRAYALMHLWASLGIFD